jgi:predicted dehydrogenase
MTINSTNHLHYKKVILSGFGPYAFSSHLKTLLAHKVEIPFVIEVADQAQRAKDILKAVGYSTTEVVSLPVEFKTSPNVPEALAQNIRKLLAPHEEALFVISSEPQGHEMWIDFALNTKMDFFVDKPILALTDITLDEKICALANEKVKSFFSRQKNRTSGKFFVGIDRPHTPIGKELFAWMDANQKLTNQLNFISISYCFGEGSTLLEQQNKENHPYKYGYGILYHSGLHLFDMLARILKIGLGSEYKMDIQALARRVPGLIHSGETDFCGVFQASHRVSSTPVMGQIHLSSLGFTRRNDFQTEIKNSYHQLKKVRAERYEIHMGPHKKLIYTGHNSGDASAEDRIEQIEYFDSSVGRTFDYSKKDFRENRDKKTALENVLFLPESAIQAADIVDGQKLLHLFTLSLCKSYSSSCQ